MSFPVKKPFSYYVRRLLREWEPRVMAVWRSSSHCTGFFSSSLDTDKTWYHCFEFQPMSDGKLSVFGSSDSVKSRFLARNLSGLTRWRSCLYGLVLRAADGAGLLVRCCSIPFARSPSAKSCFYRQANFKRWSTGSFYLIQGSMGAKIQ